MMQGSLAWNWRSDMLCFHLLFYLSALQCSIMSRVSHSNKSSDAVLLFSFVWMLNFPLIIALNGAADWSNIYFRDTWQLVWLRLEGWIPVIEGERPSSDMLHKYVQENGWWRGFGKRLSAKMNISRRGHNTCNGSVAHHILAVIHNDNGSNTASRDFISEIMHSSKPTTSNWVKKSVF